MRYEFGKKFLIKPQMRKTSQDNNLNYINFLKFLPMFFENNY